MEEEKVKKAGKYFSLLFSPMVVGAIIMFLIGAFMLVGTIASSIRERKFVEVTSTIVDIKYDEEDDMYLPTYEFKVDDETVQVEGSFPVDIRKDKIGDSVQLVYNPDNYKDFDVGSKSFNFPFLLISLLLMGLTGPFIYGYFKQLKS